MKKLLLFALLLPFYAHSQAIKNLDIKNGFLQFHLGDSLSKYKNDVYIALAKHPDENEVQPKKNPLHQYFDRVMLVSEHGIVTEIHLYLRDEGSIKYFDGLIRQAYGWGDELPNPDKNEPGTHLVVTTWSGRRVTMLMLQNNINRMVGSTLTTGRIQSIIFKKSGDAKVEGDLPDGFLL
jgi:hypothetical protein